MIPKEKAKEIIERFNTGYIIICKMSERNMYISEAKQCAIIAVENEYHSLRELLFNLRSSSVIENEKVYLSRLQGLIDEEKAVKAEIEIL